MTDSRHLTVGEEIANSVTHAVALLASAIGAVFLIGAADADGDQWRFVGCVIYAATLLTLYTTSTLYHAVTSARAKGVLRLLDHSAIYLLIAGTYTPFTLVNLRGPWGWSLLVGVWTLALLGIALKIAAGFRYPRLSTVVYLLMGWLVLVAIVPVLERVQPSGVLWLFAGGLCYTAGVIFFMRDRIRYWHPIWHVFVVAGSVCHYVAVLHYAVAPNG